MIERSIFTAIIYKTWNIWTGTFRRSQMNRQASLTKDKKWKTSCLLLSPPLGQQEMFSSLHFLTIPSAVWRYTYWLEAKFYVTTMGLCESDTKQLEAFTCTQMSRHHALKHILAPPYKGKAPHNTQSLSTMITSAQAIMTLFTRPATHTRRVDPHWVTNQRFEIYS